MPLTSFLQLILLAAIWGGSFIFMRVLSPVFGPVMTVFLRVGLAGLALSLYFGAVGFRPQWRKHGRHYFAIGVMNFAVPFWMYSFAALWIPASLSAVLNSSAPLFGTLFGALWLGERITAQKIAGLCVGFAGVALIALRGNESDTLQWHALLGAAACLGASVLYALSGIYIKRVAAHVPPLGIAGGSSTCAALCTLPLALFAPAPRADWLAPHVIGSILGLGLLCSAAAFVIYYRLLAQIGPSKALTVTFLMPLFGTLWGVLFLGETIRSEMLAGGALILTGTFWVLKAPRL